MNRFIVLALIVVGILMFACEKDQVDEEISGEIKISKSNSLLCHQ